MKSFWLSFAYGFLVGLAVGRAFDGITLLFQIPLIILISGVGSYQIHRVLSNVVIKYES